MWTNSIELGVRLRLPHLRRWQEALQVGRGYSRHAAIAAQLGKECASPLRCIHPEQGAFRGPSAPHDEGRSCPPTQINRAPVECAVRGYARRYVGMFSAVSRRSCTC